jgi:D-alanyl-D-alanine carboxypeptidase/D-alanyl-D-alanine-endopeptidase (penicillin-binding protein 4)
MRVARRALPAFLGLVAVAAWAPVRSVPAGEASATGGLAPRLERRLAKARVRADRVGVHVVDLDDGEAVFSRGAEIPLIPASVVKATTAAAALDLLGPGHRYETVVEARGTLDAAGTLAGDLVVRGSGDPALSRRAYGDAWQEPLRRLAAGVAAAGVRRVTGAIVLDDGPFDREYCHPSWPAGDRATWVAAPVCGLTWNDGCVSVRVQGGAAPGAAVTLETPATRGPWPLQNAVETEGVRAPEVGGVWTEAPARLRVSGRIGPRQEALIEVPVADPLAWFGGAFQTVLEGQGVRVDGRWRAAGPADRAPGRRVAAVSTDLPSVLRTMNRRSQNLYAALLFKACGSAREGVGSWASGERAVALSLSRRGIDATGLRVVDGAGLSRDNRLSAVAVARLLASFDGDALRGPFLRDSFAAPGEDGTLESRLREPVCRDRVRAKTGTIRGVNGLAGYVAGKGGSRGHAFAILVNASPAEGSARDLIDDLVREIAAEER